MSVIDDYLEHLSDKDRQVIEPMYAIVRGLVPDANEEFSYAMPAFKYQSKGLVAIMSNKDFYSLYPFCNIKRLGLDFSDFECTTGSIHFTADKPISQDFLRQIVQARLKLITK